MRASKENFGSQVKKKSFWTAWEKGVSHVTLNEGRNHKTRQERAYLADLPDCKTPGPNHLEVSTIIIINAIHRFHVYRHSRGMQEDISLFLFVKGWCTCNLAVAIISKVWVYRLGKI